MAKAPPAPGTAAFYIVKRPVTLIGLVFVGDEPHMICARSHLVGDLNDTAMTMARRRVMRSAQARTGAPIENIEVQDVIVLNGHPDTLRQVPRLQEVAA